MNGERDSIVNSLGGYVVDEKRTSVEGYPGKFIRFVGQNTSGELAIYFVGHRLYVLHAFAPKGTRRPQNFSEFLNSFRLAFKAETVGRRLPACRSKQRQSLSSPTSQPFSMNVFLATAALSTIRRNVSCPPWSSAENASMWTPCCQRAEAISASRPGRSAIRSVNCFTCRTTRVIFRC